MPHGSGKLVADRVKIGHQDVEKDQPQIMGEKGDLPQQRRDQEQEQKTGQRGQKSGGKNGSLVAVPVQSIPDHSVGNAHRGQGDDQVAGLDEQICDAVFCAGENAGVKRGQKEGQKPGAEGADAK